MLRFKRFSSVVLCCILVVSLAACGSPSATPAEGTQGTNTEGTSTEGPKIKDEFVIGVLATPVSYDPQYSTSNPSALVNNEIYSFLVRLNSETMEYEPDLAESWEQLSDTEYVFQLRKGVKFHDGSDFNAEDVLWTFKRGAESPGSKSTVMNFSKVEALGDYEVKITLKEMSPTFIPDVSDISRVMAIIPNGVGDELKQKPIGTGPYKFLETLTDSYVKLERFDEYWGGPKPVKYLVYKVYPEVAARIMALEAGDIDLCFNPTVSDLERIKSNPDLRVLECNSANAEVFGFNVSTPPFNDPHLRNAVAYAINKKELVDGVYNGVHTVAKSVLAPAVFGYSENIKTREYDLAKAKEEIALSKYPNGVEFNLITTSSRNTGCQLLQYQLSQIGLKMNVEFVPNVPDRTKSGYSGAYWTAIGFSSFDGGEMNMAFTKEGNVNYSYYSNEKLDVLLKKINAEKDEAKRKAMLEEAQQIVADDQPWVPLFYTKFYVAVNKNVKGVKLSPNSTHIFMDAYVEIE